MAPSPVTRNRCRTTSVALLLTAPLALILTLAPWPATAAPGLATCATVVGDAARLDCYDRISGRAGSVPAALLDAGDTATTAPMAAPLAVPAPDVPSGPGADTRRTTSGMPPAGEVLLLEREWGQAPGAERYAISLYRPNYLLVANYTNNINNRPFSPIFDALEVEEQDLDDWEVRFQLSFKTRVWATNDHRFGVWASYTQSSAWQVFNDDISRPFRETNYQPEVFVTYNPDLEFGGYHWRLAKFGYNHQSNGRSDPISRSWDRLIAEFGIERGPFALMVRPWIRLDDEDKDDDNPDIMDYMGFGDLTAYYQWRGHAFSLMGRGNLNTEKGAVEFNWTTPPLIGPIRGFVRGFAGYGDTLIDYNLNQQTIGVGFTLNSLL